jgi:hypothetical protein
MLPGPSSQTPLTQLSPPVLILSCAPVTVSSACWVTPPKDAVIVTVELAGTATGVVAVNVADVAPVAIVTLTGTPATLRLLLESATVVGDGAAALKLTVPVDVDPPGTVVGLSVRLLNTGAPGAADGVTVNVALTVLPPADPEIVTAVLAFTAVVVIVNDALEVPAAIVTLAGTVATALLLASVTAVAA